MITINDWHAMQLIERTNWLIGNAPINKIAIAKRKPLYGVGVNDASYCTCPKVNGVFVVCPSYKQWQGMLTRAYSNKFHAKHETYKCVSVCEEWHSFMSFRGWWIENQVDGWEVDKDLLSDAGVYSPETCIFVPAWLNSFTINSAARRGNHPIGASKHKATGKYQSACGNVLTGKVEYLGLFNTPGEAHLAWRTRKLEIAAELRPSMDAIDIRIYPRVVEIINNAR